MRTIALLSVTIVISALNPLSGCASDRVQLALGVDGRSFKEGEPIRLTTTVHNGTKQEIVIWRAHFFQNHRLLVENARGETPTLTESGRSLLKRDQPGPNRSRNIPVKVAPGQTVFDEEVNVCDIYHMPIGRYSIRVEYDEPQCLGFSGVLRSNVVEIEVEAPKGSAKDDMGRRVGGHALLFTLTGIEPVDRLPAWRASCRRVRGHALLFTLTGIEEEE